MDFRRPSLRRWLAVLLLVLLPLQAFAGVRTVSCAERMPHCPRMEAVGAGCCDHGMSHSGSAQNHSLHAAHDDGNQSGMPGCGGATTCAPLMPMVALPSLAQVGVLPIAEAWYRPDPSSYLSFIPDGLHRPPNFLA